MRPGTNPSPFALIVEGPNDKHVIRHLWFRHSGLNPESDDLPFRIAEKEGKPQLLEDIRLEVDTPDRDAVGFVLDADLQATDTWQSVRDRLRTTGIPAPTALDVNGLVIEPTSEFNPRIGVWVMPDNISDGELENFVAQMVPTGDPVWPRSEGYIAGIPESEREFIEEKTTRAIVHAWLAARKDPRQMGTAIRAGDLDIDSALCQHFLAWLQRLFEPQ